MAFSRISIDEAKALIDRGGVTVGDVRAADAYRAGHIDNAVHIEQETVNEFVSTAAKDQPLLLYCYHGISSQGAADYFSGLGFNEVYSLDGGYEAWRQKY